MKIDAQAPPLPKSFAEAARLRAEAEAELERICESRYFQTSRRSCEFLRYVVQVALNGRTDSLKERSIGIDLLGRDTSYDPSSDAAVRVRANEVRKRLSSFYGAAPRGRLRIELPLGSYVPVFETMAEQELTAPVARNVVAAENGPEPLGMMVLTRPVLLALVLCILLLRQQLEEREPYQRFWDHLLGGRTKLEFCMPAESERQLEAGVGPLIWIAGRYSIRPSYMATPTSDVAVAEQVTVHMHRAPSGVPGGLHWTELPQQAKSHGALLTVVGDEPGSLYVEASDNNSLRAMGERLITTERFPHELLRPLGAGQSAQVYLHEDGDGRWQCESWQSAKGSTWR